MHNSDTVRGPIPVPYVMFNVSVPAALTFYRAETVRSAKTPCSVEFAYRNRIIEGNSDSWGGAVIDAVSQYRKLREIASGRSR